MGRGRSKAGTGSAKNATAQATTTQGAATQANINRVKGAATQANINRVIGNIAAQAQNNVTQGAKNVSLTAGFTVGTYSYRTARILEQDRFDKKAKAIAKDVKDGKKPNKLKTWRPLIREAIREAWKEDGQAFGLYDPAMHKIAKALNKKYGIL